MITKDKKIKIIEKITDIAKKSLSIVFVNFHGLTVGEITELRGRLTDEGTGYTVAKKTLIKRALESQKIDGEQPVLDGEIAIAYGDDLIAPARSVYEYQKKHKGNIAIVGGVFDGVYKNLNEMVEIASIPTTDALRGMFVNVINSPIQGLVVALNAISAKKES